MMKGLMFHQQQKKQQQQQQVVVEENMSNLISPSNEANSVSSGNRTETGTSYPQQQYLAPPITTQSTTTQPPKKKRNLPGNPDPDAEIIALSPKSLLTTNRFICEICNKGFQREQNLQLHRRGHNLPWKLKQRTSKEVKKKVYVCPEPTCVHHEPSRALGDLTGIKKHFFRKHGEKKWKCEKCSKRYAVQSDWKAHSKTCGTREYRCDCGTLFSRRDSFVTHRAFCDALAEENARAITGNNDPLLPSSHPSSSSSSHHHNINLQTQFNPQDNNNNNKNNFNVFPLKREQQQHQSFNLIRPETIPPWLGPQNSTSSSIIFSTTTRLDQQGQHDLSLHKSTPNPNPSLGPTIPAYHATAAAAAVAPFPHMSATALLQKAAQMGATMSSKSTDASSIAMIRPHHQGHVSPDRAGNSLNLSTRDQDPMIATSTTTNISTSTSTTITGLIGHALLAPPFENKAAFCSSSSSANASSILYDLMMNSFSSGSGGFEGTTFEDAFGGILNNGNFKKNDENTLSKTSSATHLGGGAGGDGGGNEGLTRDFLGLRPLSHSDILSIAGIGNCMSDQQNQSQKPWQG